ncbi:hypothetical protein AAFF_G00102740 [Aldrovandia affinis]|uniref:Uncharacterized protein n=1 Tax=Aldrovandia affinis TaxID=143900 RepID=A0AAD7WB03_9TELE|nr:hypothetical protein AAFF_G00102740 [Aldrovandia affinis]
MKNNCLVGCTDFHLLRMHQREAVYSGLSSLLSEEDQYLRLLAEFPDLTQPTFSAPTVKHGVEHHIDTKGPRSTPEPGASTPPSWPSLKRSSRTWSSQHGLIVNPAKCLFGRGTIEFLGHRVTCEGLSPPGPRWKRLLPSHALSQPGR